MKQLLALIVILAIGFAGLGYYRGWFTVVSTDEKIDISFDKTKARADEEEFRTNARQAVKDWRGVEGETPAEGSPQPGQAIPPGKAGPAKALPPKK